MVDITRVACKPKVPHQLKMMAKKILRKQNGTADDWRDLVDQTHEEVINAADSDR
jgi:hypothetical protein